MQFISSTPSEAHTRLATLHLREGGAEPALFGVLHEPPAGMPSRSAVLHVPAFAEEMNKSRRMVAQTARALAADGHTVLVLDLRGCGDSGGELADASWAGWLDDVSWAWRWLAAQAPGLPRWLWGHRAGALLAAQALAERRLGDTPVHLLLWQPVIEGRLHLQQFLRLKLAAALHDSNGSKGQMDQLKASLAAGEVVEVAGYPLPGAVAAGLEAATLIPAAPAEPGPAAATPVSAHWLEVSARAPASLLPASWKALHRLSALGWSVHSSAVAGPAFWQTVEIEEAPELVAATLGSVAQGLAGGAAAAGEGATA